MQDFAIQYSKQSKINLSSAFEARTLQRQVARSDVGRRFECNFTFVFRDLTRGLLQEDGRQRSRLNICSSASSAAAATTSTLESFVFGAIKLSAAESQGLEGDLETQPTQHNQTAQGHISLLRQSPRYHQPAKHPQLTIATCPTTSASQRVQAPAMGHVSSSSARRRVVHNGTRFYRGDGGRCREARTI